MRLEVDGDNELKNAHGRRSLRFLLLAVAGWINERQSQTIDYLREENRVLREQIGNRRLRFNDDQRQQLAVRPKV